MADAGSTGTAIVRDDGVDLDLELPERSGEQPRARLRQRRSDTGVIVLTSPVQSAQRVRSNDVASTSTVIGVYVVHLRHGPGKGRIEAAREAGHRFVP